VSREPTGTGAAARADSRTGAADSARFVVGVDGSPGASAALVRAPAEAARSGAGVEVVSASPVDDHGNDPPLADPRRVETHGSDTEARARAFVARATGDPGVTAVPRAAAVEVFSAIAAGLHCVVHATCPVVVVRPEPSPVAVRAQPSGVPARV
jgi:universal stress protein family protein